jgi:hypothetical protein
MRVFMGMPHAKDLINCQKAKLKQEKLKAQARVQPLEESGAPIMDET